MVHANLLFAALSGLIGAVIMTILIYVLKNAGQDINIPYLLGSYFVDINNTRRVYITGILLHLLAGAAWGVLYIIILTGLAIYPNWPAGILYGFAHGIFIGVILSTITQTHPYMGEGKVIPEPGILGRRWSALMPYWILGLHVIFGVVTLLSYRVMVSPH